MEKPKLTTQQIILRTLFMLMAIAIVGWFFPHNEMFRYEYEVGKPWRYGRLSAPYDFAIYRSDSAILQMEDSLQRLIVPRYQVDATVGETVLRDLRSRRFNLPSEAIHHLQEQLALFYTQGIVSGDERERLDQQNCPEVILVNKDQASTVDAKTLLSERQAYDRLRNDSLFSHDYAAFSLQRYLRSNLVPDTLAMRLEYARLRQQVSSTSGVVLAESRIIDNGEIVTPRIYDILESYRREQQQRMGLTSSETLQWVGRLLLVALILCSNLLFLWLYRPWHYRDQTRVFVAIGSIVVMVVLTSLANRWMVGGVYLVPIGIVTILLSTFLGSRTAFYCHIGMVLLCSFLAPSHYEYLIIQSIIGMVIIFYLKDGLQERGQLLHVSILCALSYVGIYLLYTLSTEGTLANVSFPILAMMVVNAILLLLSYLIVGAMERMFGFMSGVSLIELGNLNKGLLLQLSNKAPGTFNHSIQVGNLAANAAKLVKADVGLVRTGALYHDIGKMVNPRMFTENQEGVNLHDTLSVEESVETIKKHVSAGVAKAKEAKLPQEIIDFILTHHGCSQVRYFYNKWCNEHPGETPDEEFFSYPGPDPVTVEQAILMMADSIEAASRSLKEFSHESISNLVNTIVDGMLWSGRFNHAKISLHDISLCKESFIRDLESINHTRIAYPELKKSNSQL